jgi:dTDP-4-dehydrorhamnose reductase
MMKVLILGGEGMLGHKIFEVLGNRYDVFATFFTPQGLWNQFPIYRSVGADRLIGGVNAMDFDSVVRAVERIRPAAVVNCIGIIKQLKEASDPLISLELNSVFPHRLADLCALADARLFHISTDCVFSGRKGNYKETDVSDAEDLYGRTKYLGEIDRTGCLTIRTSIFGRDFLKSSAFLEWFLSCREGRIKGYRNSIYSGFPTQVLARIIGDLIASFPKLSGLYQIASQPISKYELLLRIRAKMKLNIEIEPFEDPTCDRSLNADRFISATGYQIPSWDQMLAELGNERIDYDEWRNKHAIV